MFGTLVVEGIRSANLICTGVMSISVFDYQRVPTKRPLRFLFDGSFINPITYT